MLEKAKKEILEIILVLRNVEFWSYLAWSDIKARYRRTTLGPFWLVLSNAVLIAGMGIIWSVVFKMELHDFFPKITAAMICWILISTSINEFSLTFTQHSSIIHNLPVSLYLFPIRVLCRNIIAFFHNALIYVFVLFTFRHNPGLSILYFFPFFFLVILNFFFIGFIVGMIGARFRDIQQVIVSVMSVLVFLTPVMWDTSMIQKYQIIVILNPLAHFLLVLKNPLLGFEIPYYSIIFVVFSTFASFGCMLYVASKFKNRIAYWV